MKKNILLTALAFFAISVFAESYSPYYINEVLSLKLERSHIYKSDGNFVLNTLKSDIDPKTDVTDVKWYNSRAARISYAPAAFFAMGAITWPYREDVRDWRNRFIPDYHNSFDDLLQYTPIMAVYGLNWAGVKGKHGLKRTTVTWAMSLAMMGIVVNGMKYSIGEMRPDGSSANSFPSGHTAMAFVSATMLHKEFGQYRSPLYSFFGYAAAGWTGMMRQLNNRHWVSDVMVGAGIGILTTEVAYILAERIYDEKETNPELFRTPKPFLERNPSFLSVKVGFAKPMGDLADNKQGAYTTSGFTTGFEGAYFFTHNIGIGGEMSLTSFPIKSDKISISTELTPYIKQASNGDYEIQTQATGSSYYTFGPYGYFDLSSKFGLLVNVGAGYSRGAEGQIFADLNESGQALVGQDQIAILKYEPEDAFAWNTGGQLWYKINDKITFGAYTRFMFNNTKMHIHDIVEVNDDGEPVFDYSGAMDFDFSHWSLGISINALL